MNRIGSFCIAFTLGVAGVVSDAVKANDVRWRFPKQTTMSPTGVNLQTGRFSYSKTDFSIGPLKFVRTWGETPSITVAERSMGTLATYAVGSAGWTAHNSGWSHNFNQGVAYVAATGYFVATVHVVVDGQEYQFGKLPDNSIVPSNQGSQGTTLTMSSGQWQFTDRGGARYVFVVHSALSQGGAPGMQQLLQSVTYADGARTDYTYDAAGRPEFIRDNRGYAIGIEYTAHGNVASACGFDLATTYADAATACSSAILRVQYGYDAAGARLTSVTDIDGDIVTMTYQTTSIGSGLLTCISLPNDPGCEIQNIYGAAPGALFNYVDQVRQQTTASGRIWSYAFMPAPDPADVPIVPGMPRYSTASMEDPAGAAYGFRYDRGHLVEARSPSPASNSVYDLVPTNYRYAYMKYDVYAPNTLDPPTYQYYDDRPRLVISPEGDSQYLFHDGRGNVTVHSYWPKGAPNPAQHLDPALINCCTIPGDVTPPAGAITYRQTFLPNAGVISALGSVYVLGCGAGPSDAKVCDKPLTRTDARGNQTDYTYDPAHGMVLTETAPAVNGVRPQTRFTYQQRYTWLKSSGSGYVQSANPIWVLTEKSICKTGSASGAGCAVASDETRTTYEYGPDSGPNNLLLRGVVEDAGGLALRTCYTYDTFGNRIAERKPGAGVTSCL